MDQLCLNVNRVRGEKIQPVLSAVSTVASIGGSGGFGIWGG